MSCSQWEVLGNVCTLVKSQQSQTFPQDHAVYSQTPRLELAGLYFGVGMALYSAWYAKET